MLAAMSGKSSIRNLIAGTLGVLISTVGVHLATGVERFDFGVQAGGDFNAWNLSNIIKEEIKEALS